MLSWLDNSAPTEHYLVAGDEQSLKGGFMQILQNSLLLLLQPALCLLHVLRHWVLPQKLHRLADVKSFSILQELILEAFLVD